MTSAIDRILGQLNESDDSVTEKTAEAETPSLEENMLNKVREVSEATAKTATEETKSKPVEELEKMATDAAKAEEERLQKQAETMGSWVADGFMSRMAVYEKALPAVKTASEDEIKQAYDKGREDVEKEASEAYEKGYNDQLAEIHKIAAHIHYVGQDAAAQLVNAAVEENKK